MLIRFDEMDTTTNLSLCYYGDDDYIDMELSSSPSSIVCCSANSSPKSREFEFQMSITSNEKETTTSPADELFYEGKLLPLHLSARRIMVKKLLHTTAATTTFNITKDSFEDHYYTIPFPYCSTAPCTNSLNTALDPCSISPSESCRVSCELDPDDYFFEWSNELNCFIKNRPTKMALSKKLKLINHSILGQKLKASKAYLRSFFSKSACSDEPCTKVNCNAAFENSAKADDRSSNKYLKISKEKPFRHIDASPYSTIGTIMKNNNKEETVDTVQRKSFSSAIKRHSPAKCLSLSSSNSSSSSSSFSLSSKGYNEQHFLRRSSSATEIEGSIEAAIAHCKKSSQIFGPGNSLREP